MLDRLKLLAKIKKHYNCKTNPIVMVETTNYYYIKIYVKEKISISKFHAVTKIDIPNNWIEICVNKFQTN